MKIKFRDLQKKSLLPLEKFELIAGELLKISKEKLFVAKDILELTPQQVNKIKLIEDQILSDIPFEYVFQKAHFYSSEFFVNKNVLIPRPETELLIDEAVKFIQNQPKACVLDLGTGSGCIAITIKKLFPSSKITAVDISSKALIVAKKNSNNHKVEINFIKSDLFENVDTKFDLIVANLPYVSTLESNFTKLADPRTATDGGKDGFEIIERALKSLPDFLNANGLAIFEIGYDQEMLIKATVAQIGLKCRIIKDLSGFYRFAVIS